MTHVVIIGAGPAGLASAACLARRGIGYTLLERGDAPAAGLRRVDPAMRLFSPARLSRLPGMDTAWLGATYPTFGQFVAALDRYRETFALDVTTHTEVTAIEREPVGFAVSCATALGKTVVRGTHVINATGIVSAPRLPEDLPPNSGGPMRVMHSLDVRAADVAAARQLLVVGGGASAADVLANWLRVRQPDDRAWISLRSPLKAVPSHLFGLDLHYVTWLPEHLPARPLGPRLVSSDTMFGLTVPRAIRAGVIQRVGGVARYQPDQVAIMGGETLQPDLLVLATGFRPVTAHLGALADVDAGGWPIAHRCRSPREPRLAFVGARFARTFASPYIRGIARDAAYIARRIAGDR
jgi:putative flavoprotein involved in K+ transport